MNLLEMRKKRADARAAGKKVIADAVAAGRSEETLTDDELTALKAHVAEGKTLDEQIEAAEQRKTVADWLDVDPKPASAPKQVVTDPARIEVAPTYQRTKKMTAFTGPKAEERAYAFGRWAHATILNPRREPNSSTRWCNDHGIKIEAAMSEGVDSAGGYLVPNEYETTIIDLREQYGLARRLCKISPMGSDTKSVPVKVSGLTAYFVAEGASGTASQAVFRNVNLVAKSAQTETTYSSELSEDAFIDVANDIAQDAAYSLALLEDQCFLLGDNTSTYGNIRGVKTKINDGNYTASIVTAADGNTAFSTLDLDDFSSMVGKLPMFPGINPVWIISKIGWDASMARLQYAAGGATLTEIANGASVTTFLGIPVIFAPGSLMNTTLAAQTSTTSLCLLGDFNMSTLFGSRRGLVMTSDPYTLMNQRQIKVYTTERFDLVNHSLGDTSSAGPVISLSTPGS